MQRCNQWLWSLYIRYVRRARFVGQDIWGNTYYTSRRTNRRFVVYGPLIDASTVTPDWHGWLHHSTNDHPQEAAYPAYAWQKNPLPDLSGTIFEYTPPPLPLQKVLPYTAWTPPTESTSYEK